ncbi:PREDICTED: uncharacterized protein K02A2.6-like [Trachymyrmex cornetzi]|uniref:uncharacterized protein K02A2.6-like n=1 Tax=Trachymyrmex cornetzi TaxID=471704 RepID=UPI00084F6A9E|nr:PREDICTED: uncharacterized protein K02A2.6-like [Trachymyrmex cornetzi]
MHGYPQNLVSDNATIFKNPEFENYCKVRGIFQMFTAPGHPATNGLAERYVQTLKSKLIRMEDEPGSITEKIQKILLRVPATPLADGKSPAELYLNRQIHIRMDAFRPYKPAPNPVSPVRHLKVGQRVIVRTYLPNKSEWRLGTILQKFGKLHYQVKLDNGHVLKRHIDQLRTTSLSTPIPKVQTPEKSTQNRKQVTFQKEPDLSNYDFIYLPDPQVRRQQQQHTRHQPNPEPPVRPARQRREPQRFKDYIQY